MRIKTVYIKGTKLVKDELWDVPNISTDFIEKFAKEYNKGNIIKEVMLEYGYTIDKSSGHFHQRREYFLKRNDNMNDNMVIIHSVERAEFTEDEMYKAWEAGAQAHDDGDWTQEKFKEWLNEKIIKSK